MYRYNLANVNTVPNSAAKQLRLNRGSTTNRIHLLCKVLLCLPWNSECLLIAACL